MLRRGVNIGELDRRITFQEPVYERGSANSDVISSWNDFDTVWARVNDRLGNEVAEADRVTHIQTTLFTIRYREDITLDMRIIYGGFIYRILSPPIANKANRKGFLDITAEFQDTTET